MPRIYVTEKVYERLQALRTKRSGSLSAAVGSILDEVVDRPFDLSATVDRQFDLSATKDTGLIGAIGETIAWQYLWERGVIAFELGHGRPSFKPIGVPVHLDRGLTEQQIRFLGEAREHLSWDFVGYLRNQACLIEVKTSRPGKPTDGLRPQGRKGMDRDSIEEARRLGFTLLLVNVELTEDWQAIVTDREIPVN